jgi:hypothetical protein
MGSTPYLVLLDALGPGARRENGLPELDHAPDPWESSIDRGVLTEEELRTRMDAVRARLTRE